MNKLKENLVRIMKAAGDDPDKLAAAAGVDRGFIEGIANGAINAVEGQELAPLRALDTIAKHYGVTVDNLLNTELVPVTIFAPKAVVDYYGKNPAMAERLAGRVSEYVAPSIRDIGTGVRGGWGESIATSATSGATSGATAGVVAYSVAGPTPLPGPE